MEPSVSPLINCCRKLSIRRPNPLLKPPRALSAGMRQRPLPPGAPPPFCLTIAPQATGRPSFACNSRTSRARPAAERAAQTPSRPAPPPKPAQTLSFSRGDASNANEARQSRRFIFLTISNREFSLERDETPRRVQIEPERADWKALRRSPVAFTDGARPRGRNRET